MKIKTLSLALISLISSNFVIASEKTHSQIKTQEISETKKKEEPYLYLMKVYTVPSYVGAVSGTGVYDQNSPIVNVEGKYEKSGGAGVGDKTGKFIFSFKYTPKKSDLFVGSFKLNDNSFKEENKNQDYIIDLSYDNTGNNNYDITLSYDGFQRQDQLREEGSTYWEVSGQYNIKTDDVLRIDSPVYEYKGDTYKNIYLIRINKGN